eukprot:UN04057
MATRVVSKARVLQPALNRALTYSAKGSNFPQPNGEPLQTLVEIYEDSPHELDCLEKKQLRLINQRTHKFMMEEDLARCRLLVNPEELEEVVHGMTQAST